MMTRAQRLATMLEELPPAPKRAKIVVTREEAPAYETDRVLRHPLGIKPSGNAYTASTDAKNAAGYFSTLPDELFAHVLEYLTASDALQLGGTCRVWHAFCRNEELWRALFVEYDTLRLRRRVTAETRSQPTTDFKWQGTWRSTFLGQDQSREPSVDCSDVYSDLLHRPNFCAHVHLLHYTQNIPPANEIARLQDLTVEEFEAKWVDRPFILTQPVKQWKAYCDWSIEYLRDRYKEVGFRAESVDWPLATYMDYLSSSSDESPLYLFDRDFADKMKLKITDEKDGTADYWPPTCFGFDAFSVLGEERPDHRWLIVGPPRSGSTFHKDPNATSAWNAVIRGSKYWIMFRSSPAIPPPPGVFVSADQSEVTSPLSIAEWLLGYHAEARRTPGCREGVCHEGEVLYVPSGWYHLVLNMETSIALTQNFVPPARVGSVLQFLRDQRQSVSGFSAAVADPFQLFLDRLRAWDPRLLEHGLEDLGRLTGSTKTRWERAVEIKPESEVGQGGEFSFGFEVFEGDEAA